MTSERLKEMVKTRPFRAFGLRLADGEVIRVDHPDFIASSPSGRTTVVFGKDDTMKVIDVFLVTALETFPEKRRNGGGGARR